MNKNNLFLLLTVLLLSISSASAERYEPKTEAEFNEYIKEQPWAVVYFNPFPQELDEEILELAALEKAFEELSEDQELQDISFIIVNLDEIPSLLTEYGVDETLQLTKYKRSSIKPEMFPALVMMFKNGKPLKRNGDIVQFSGTFTQKKLANFINNAVSGLSVTEDSTEDQEIFEEERSEDQEIPEMVETSTSVPPTKIEQYFYYGDDADDGYYYPYSYYPWWWFGYTPWWFWWGSFYGYDLGRFTRQYRRAYYRRPYRRDWRQRPSAVRPGRPRRAVSRGVSGIRPGITPTRAARRAAAVTPTRAARRTAATTPTRVTRQTERPVAAATRPTRVERRTTVTTTPTRVTRRTERPVAAATRPVRAARGTMVSSMPVREARRSGSFSAGTRSFGGGSMRGGGGSFGGGRRGGGRRR